MLRTKTRAPSDWVGVGVRVGVRVRVGVGVGVWGLRGLRGVTPYRCLVAYPWASKQTDVTHGSPSRQKNNIFKG